MGVVVVVVVVVMLLHTIFKLHYMHSSECGLLLQTQ